jgi:hypothetical protein
LTEDELESLIWILTFGENNEGSTEYHKIGHGKPIGLGSVKIVVKSTLERSFTDGRYEVRQSVAPALKTADEIKLLKASKPQVEQILKIADMGECKFPVTYPQIVKDNGLPYDNDGKNDHASHQWFTENFQLGKEPRKALPEIGMQNDSSKALQYYKFNEAEYGNRGNNQNRGNNRDGGKTNFSGSKGGFKNKGGYNNKNR